ncbi:hypothetical protein VPH219E481_0086 [Vibrio phage 219E48-1]|nr:hypothetical protein PODOV021v1_p0072 [Vibrio phage 219E41.2]QZI91061.1 hypothetical protein PODOV032v1_p0056 [Vibrio phage 219E41.1]
MKHKHYDMIVAKAANMELETFIKEGGEWRLMNNAIPISESFDYFLCLPQHKEFCLHWLNGGDVQDFFEEEWSDCASLAHATEVGGDNTLEFSMHHMFMNEEFNFRIAPKKEKRWIAFNSKALMTTRDTYTTGVECEDALNEVGEIYENHPWQFIEIEVEVTE